MFETSNVFGNWLSRPSRPPGPHPRVCRHDLRAARPSPRPERTRIAPGLPRHHVLSAHARQAHPREGRRRSPGRPPCLPAGRRDRAPGRGHLHRQLHPAQETWDRLDLHPLVGACPSPSPRHACLSLACEAHGQDRHPQPGAGHQDRRRRPHYRFVGIEVTARGATRSTGPYSDNNVVYLESEGGQTSPSQVPTEIIFDRCYVHGTPTGSVRRGIAMNGARMAVVDSYLSDFHEVGADSQAISGWNGPGPFKIVNNYLEGAGENLMFGGADPSIPDLVPSDIEIRGNYLFKPLCWKIGHPTYAGTPWSVKNIFELKNARRVLAEGNLLEHNWQHDQNGFAILFTVRNQDGGAPWCTVEDVTFRKNILRHAGGGFNILAADNNFPSQQTKRILIQDNLLDDISSVNWGGTGRLFQFLSLDSRDTGILELTVEHNTGFSNAWSAYTGDKPIAVHRSFTFRNNIAPKRTHGFAGGTKSWPPSPPVTGDGSQTLNTFYIA